MFADLQCGLDIFYEMFGGLRKKVYFCRKELKKNSVMAKKYEIPEENSQMVNEPSLAYSIDPRPVFTGYQMQILDSIANVRDEKELRDIRDLIAEYFSNKALDAMDELCDEGGLSTKIIEGWHAEHMRTPYNC